ncbi:MAG: hypothetical protein Q9166_008069 [cf. Caloplaca sp. 2 TL-2023]
MTPLLSHITYTDHCDLAQRNIMCNFERITYHCRHQIFRRYAYCHFARNDPVHACFGVKVLKREWDQVEEDCDDCIRQREKMMQQQQQQRLQPYRPS